MSHSFAPFRRFASIHLARSAFSTPWLPLRRAYLVRFSATPNSACYKFFVDGVTFLPSGSGGGTVRFTLENSYQSPLADQLLRQLPMVEEVTIGPHFVTVRRVASEAAAAAAHYFVEKTLPDAHSDASPNATDGDAAAVDESVLRDLIATADWSELKLHVSALLTDHLFSGAPHIDARAPHPHPDTLPCEGDAEVVLALKELIATTIRPELQRDGGDIRFVRLDGAVMEVEMLGACRRCASSKTTLRDLIERTTRHWVPEVTGVREVESEAAPYAKGKEREEGEYRDGGK